MKEVGGVKPRRPSQQLDRQDGRQEGAWGSKPGRSYIRSPHGHSRRFWNPDSLGAGPGETQFTLRRLICQSEGDFLFIVQLDVVQPCWITGRMSQAACVQSD